MRYLNVGTAKRISKVGLGTSQFGSRDWGYSESYANSEPHAIVRRALDLGITLFDTAEIYGGGRSERILGRAIGPDRASVFVGTKLFPFLPGARRVGKRAAASASRLGLDRLDLYQVHWPNPFVSDDTLMEGMRAAQETGLIEEVGVSGYDLQRWRSAECALGSRVLTNQVRYNLLDRSPELNLLTFAQDSGHAVIAFSPLAMGLLSGRYRGTDRRPVNTRASHPLFDATHVRRTENLISTLREVGRAHAVTPAQIALAWVIHFPAVAAIPGASSVEQVEQNAAAADVHLAEDEYDALCAASAALLPCVTPAGPPRRDLAALRHLASAGKHLAATIYQDCKANVD
jgi:aryl-alcohol dehydrogenase-like predicted oxidoreductase